MAPHRVALPHWRLHDPPLLSISDRSPYAGASPPRAATQFGAVLVPGGLKNNVLRQLIELAELFSKR